MKIAVVGLRGIPASWGGIEHHCEQLYSRLVKKGHAVTLYARSAYSSREVRSFKGISIRRLPTINTKYTEAFVHTFLAMLCILRDNPDVVHIHAQGPCLFSWMPRVARPRMRVFFTCHGLDWQRRKWPQWASRIIRLGEYCSAVFPHCRIAVSRQIQSYYQTRYGVHAVYIPNGIERSEKRSAAGIRRLGLGTGQYFLYVGRLVPEKRVEDIIQAFISRPRTKKLVIAGDSADTKHYRRRLEALAGGHPSVLFLGYQYGEVLKALYSNALAFVSASELEGLPLTFLEALSFGSQCIVSDIAPHREVVRQAGGTLFPTGDQAALAERMDAVEALTQKCLNEAGRGAMERVLSHYNWDRAAEQIDTLLREGRGG